MILYHILWYVVGVLIGLSFPICYSHSSSCTLKKLPSPWASWGTLTPSKAAPSQPNICSKTGANDFTPWNMMDFPSFPSRVNYRFVPLGRFSSILQYVAPSEALSWHAGCAQWAVPLTFKPSNSKPEGTIQRNSQRIGWSKSGSRDFSFF